MAFELMPRRYHGEMRRFQREMQDLWDRFFSESPLERWTSREWSPSVDISETDGSIEVKAEIPGFDSKDIDLSVAGDVLTIKGEKKTEEKKEKKQYHYREISSSSFQRSFQLPASINSEAVDAEFKNGVLHISLPKAEENNKKKIDIKS
jgi:HSP20 family protein